MDFYGGLCGNVMCKHALSHNPNVIGNDRFYKQLECHKVVPVATKFIFYSNRA